jgi:hypothetical protein
MVRIRVAPRIRVFEDADNADVQKELAIMLRMKETRIAQRGR